MGSEHANVQRTETGCGPHARKEEEDEPDVAVEPGAPRPPHGPAPRGAPFTGSEHPERLAGRLLPPLCCGTFRSSVPARRLPDGRLCVSEFTERGVSSRDKLNTDK